MGHLILRTRISVQHLFTIGSHPNEFIVNFHSAERPDDSFVLYDTTPHANMEEWIAAGSKIELGANDFKVNTVDELERYVSWADLKLRAETTYYVVTGYKRNNEIVLSKQYKIRTLPSTGPFSFVSGGDMSYDADGHHLMKLAAAKDPYFAMVGGDITYDNGFPSCYYRWDQWFNSWEQIMVTSQNFSIPILASIGNHEAGGFFGKSGDDPYYSTYFPQETGIEDVPPNSRLTYHSHWLRSDILALVLDSDIIARIGGDQAKWIESELQNAKNARLTMTLYHGNLYPATTDPSISADGKKYWGPIFDKYNLTVSFENHCHAYKRTIPLRGDKPATEGGVVYLGDGAWGVNPRPVHHSWYTAVVEKKQFVFNVAVGGDTLKVDAFGMDDAVFDSWQTSIVQK